ncbi:hypothetical protein [Sphingomonas bacterium]|uniref:hypothetical protein n=1 Tax=Sphingomonas bacterium TaxID=1895847 RepID=UPI0020C70B6F|nr:hypothetical protein [Sphingomonas bacterium]
MVLAAGMYGVETANLALVNLRISQIALNLADDAARVGVTPLSTEQLREVDMNDVLQAARYQGSSIGLTNRGRVIISSLENIQQSYDAAPVQRIHWQRCIGQKGSVLADSAYNSSYGTATPVVTAGTDSTPANAGTLQPLGMGDPGSTVSAPPGSGVVFVEINYNYKPLISNYLIGTTSRIHYVASFIVRDNRDFSHIYPSPASVPSTCDKYNA